MPEISVIVPVYRVERYLYGCVNSLIAQTFSDIEIILVDDGSPDNCGRMCDELAAQDSRIRVIHQQNKGLSGARNTGITAAKGTYLCFVDSDDLVAPDYCRVLLELLKSGSFDFSFCAAYRFADGTEPKPEQTEMDAYPVTAAQYLQLQLEKKTEFGVWNKLFPRRVFDSLRFAEKRLNEDVLFSADMLQSLSGGIGTAQPLYYYRQRSDGIVSTQAHKGAPDRVFAGAYLLEAVEASCPELTEQALRYAVEYPWMFVDPIYVHRSFKENRAYLSYLQAFLKERIGKYENCRIFPKIQIRRMKLFARSKVLYGVNAYARLLRVYLYRVLKKDAYADGHGI